MRPVVVDCTELYQNPVRTGIQRVVRELIRHWPSHGPKLYPARFVPNTPEGLTSISDSSVALLTDADERALSMSSVQVAKLANDLDGIEPRADLPHNCHVLIPEVFFESLRSEYYTWLAQTRKNDICAICYDFTPFLRPDLFANIRTCSVFMPYLYALRACSRLAHISDQTREEYASRIARVPILDAGIVLPLGADGLKIERQIWRFDRKEFLGIGSIDGRKRQEIAAEAFRLLRERGHKVNLTLIGRAFEQRDLRWLEQSSKIPGFKWIDDAPDTTVAASLRNARATIYVSEAEGYGLPPVESLWSGVPVIVSANMPSLASLEPLGQIRIGNVTPETVADSMLYLMNNANAERCWAEAELLKLPTWYGFAQATADWVSERTPVRGAIS